jgi:hypothetical protein
MIDLAVEPKEVRVKIQILSKIGWGLKSPHHTILHLMDLTTPTLFHLTHILLRVQKTKGRRKKKVRGI